MTNSRIETTTDGDLSQVYMWFSEHRGELVAIGPDARVAIGLPIAGTRGVTCAVAAFGRDGSRTVTGAITALAGRTLHDPVLVILTTRRPAPAGHLLLDALVRRMESDTPTAIVA